MKRVISVLVTVMLLFQMAAPAFADTQRTVGNAVQQNQSLLEKLSRMHGDDLTYQDVVSELENMGLIDKDGTLTVSETITVDGTPMTLAQAKALIEKGGADLTKKITVDGYRITLGDLKIMLEIEDELARIKAAYFSGKTPFTSANAPYLKSLFDQIATEGITLGDGSGGGSDGGGQPPGGITNGGIEPAEDVTNGGGPAGEGITPSALSFSGMGLLSSEPEINQDARIQITANQTTFENNQNLNLTFSLVDKNGSPISGGLGYDVSFKWRPLDGSAKKGEIYRMWTEDGFAQEGKVTISAGAVSVQARLDVFAYIDDYDLAYSRWNGDKLFLIQAYDPENILFYNGPSDSSARSVSLPVTAENTYAWATKITNALGYTVLDVKPEADGFAIDVERNDQINAGFSTANKKAILRTAEDVFGSIEAARFEFYPWLKFMSTDSSSYTMTAAPKLLNASGTPIPNAQYTIGSSSEGPPFSLAVNSENRPDPVGHQFYVRFSGAWPHTFRLTDLSFSPPYGPNGITIKEDGLSSIALKIYDREAPSVKSITAPAGTYYSGQTIPITVEFSEPVKTRTLVSDDPPESPSGPLLTLTVKEGQSKQTTLTVEEENPTVSKLMTFLYTVPANPSAQLIVASVNHIQDMAEIDPREGNPPNTTGVWPADGQTTTVDGVTMMPDPIQAFEGLSVDKPAGYEGGDTIQVRLDIDKASSPWLEQPEEVDIVTKQLKKVYLKAEGDTYPLTMGGTGSSEGSYYTASIPAVNYAQQGTTKSLKIGLYMNGTYTPPDGDTPGSFSGGIPVMGKTVTAAINPVILATGVTLDTASYPLNYKIYLTDSYTLTASAVPANASYKTVQWSSGNPAVASINASTGAITPVSSGTVTFAAIIHNGGFGAPVSAVTPGFTVDVSGVPALLFPAGNNAFYTKKGEGLNVTWRQNLIGKVPSVVFTADVYPGYFQDSASISGTAAWTGSVTNASSIQIPAGILNTASDGTAPAYTVKVSAENPDNHTTMSAIGYLIVYPQPAKVAFHKLSSYYITDAVNSLNIGWTLSDFVSSGGQFELKIQKNQEAPVTSGSSGSGSYTLNLDDVAPGALRDVYTVSVKAKNQSDDSWSTDSFLLYVYQDAAMKILVDGADRSDLTLDNKASVQGLSSADILALNRQIWLKSGLSINYGDYDWGSVTDQVRWASANSGTASVNYKQGGLYENIERFSYDAYRPSTEFMLVGHDAGAAKITATHAATGMQDTLDVTVKTLKDKLYLFNFYPRQTTAVTYTNGDGTVRNLTSNADGELAVYEEKGIRSEIRLKSGGASDLYLGTLYKEKLVSSERNAGIYELYPVNIFKLRPAAKVELFFKKADGTPFTGTVAYGGAVYKNGQLCSDTLTAGGSSLAIPADGRFTLNLDATSFWTDSPGEELTGTEKLEFIYEVLIPGYYPHLITVNGNISIEDVVRFGESVVNLKPAGAADQNKPFMLSQAVDYNLISGRTIDVTNYTGSVGPSNQYPSADLLSTAAWWGLPFVSGYGVKIEDEYGNAIDGQRVRTILYPFATMAYTQNVMPMTETNLNLAIGAKKGAEASFYLPDGSLVRHLQSPFSFTNMVGAPDADDPNKGVKNALNDINESGDLEFDPSNIQGADGIIGTALAMMDGTSLGGQFINLVINATEDPKVYRGLVTMTQTLGQTEDIPEPNIEIKGPEKPELEMNPTQLFGAVMDPNYMKDMDEAMEKAVTGGVDYGISIKGYFEVEIRYDTDAAKWTMIVVGGGFDLDALIGYTWTFNQMVGPVPVTAEFGLGAQSQLQFRAIRPYGSVPAGINAADVNDLFTALRLNLYVKAFGGFGFDYSVVALKIGVFGQVNLGYNFESLNRSYLAPSPQGYDSIQATQINMSGQVGIKFVAKLVFISYEYVLASVSYGGSIYDGPSPNNRLIQEWKDAQATTMPLSGSLQDTLFLSAMEYGRENALKVISQDTGFESRDYLDQYSRAWGGAGGAGTPGGAGQNEMTGLMALGTTGASGAMGTLGTRGASGAMEALGTQSDILTNAYPYANPVVTRDGSILAYLSDGGSMDLNETRASWAASSGGGYMDQGAIAPPAGVALADSNLKLDGIGSFAAAAWERQGVTISTSGGVTSEDVSAMLNSTEILASVYNGASWSTTALTDNLVPDLAPAVAANNEKAIVAWRSTAGSDMSLGDLSYDDVHDSILYRIYSGGSWGPVKTLYNGTSGNVKALSASMMDDGTAAVSYVLDCGTTQTNPAFGYEAFCGVIDGSGDPASALRLTNDEAIDENPQIVTADFGSSEGGKKFVLGWAHTASGAAIDVRLASVGKDGVLYDGFVDSLSSITGNSSPNITGNFRFAKGEGMNITDLSMLWVEPSTGQDSNPPVSGDRPTAKDSLKAVKFMKDGSGSADRFYLTGTLDVAAMADHTAIDHFDAYTSGADQVDAVLLTSSYTGPLVSSGGIYTVSSVSDMKSVSAAFKNAIDVEQVYLDYREIRSGFTLPVQFTVVNKGIDPINAVSITFTPGQIYPFTLAAPILPNQAAVLTVNYDVPATIRDINYEVKATFANAGNEIKTGGGFLNLDAPDTGISNLELVGDEQGKRVIQATLQNLSDVPLAGGGRKVFVGLYASSVYNAASKIGEMEITGADLALLDESALTVRFTYTVPPSGIPSGGIRLYARIWAEENTGSGYEEVVEYYQDNNARSILIPNPIEANNGNPVLVSVIQENSASATTARVTVKNLSMTPIANGNVSLQLLDASDKVTETKLLANTVGGLLNLSGEASTTAAIAFTGLGARVRAEYYTADPGSADGISNIILSGIRMDYNENTPSYSLTASNLSSTTITATAKSLGGAVQIKNLSSNQTVSGVGAASYTLPLAGAAPTAVEVSSADKRYTLSISSTGSPGAAIVLEAASPAYAPVTVTVNANNIAGFSPVKWQYVKNGEWSSELNWNVSGNQFTLSPAGNYTVGARLIAADGSYIDSATKYIVVSSHSSGGSGGAAGTAPTPAPVKTDGTVIEFTGKINLTPEGASAVIPKEFLTEAAAVTGASLRIDAEIAVILFDEAALDAISGAATGDVTLDIRKADTSGLSDADKLKLGDRPALDFSLTSGGKAISDLGGGTAKISIPYALTGTEADHPEAIVIWYIDGSGALTMVTNGHYDSATGTVTFTVTHFSSYAVGYNPASFRDVSASVWYKPAVGFIAAREITTGTGNGNFSPKAKLTRGQFLVMVMKAYGIAPDRADSSAADDGTTDSSAAVNGATANFADAGNTYYTGYLAAAKRQAITNGVGNNLFAPEKQITRQEMFTLLYNVLKVIDSLPKGDSGKSLSSFGDADQVASWARDAMTALVKTGTIGGSNGMLIPAGATTRAEMAQVLYNLLSN